MHDFVVSLVADWRSAGLAVALSLLTALLLAARRGRTKLRHATAALNHMPQGLCMFDAATRIVVCNPKYLRMYKLSADVVKPGCTLRRLMEHRKEAGLFTGNVDKFCKDIVDSVASGKTTNWFIGARDGRTVHVINEPMPDGGWIATHEDLTEHRLLKQQREELAAQQSRRSAVEAIILDFRGRMETLLKTFGDSAAAMRSTAVTLSNASNQTSQRAENAVAASDDASDGMKSAAQVTEELSSSIAEIARQIEQTHGVVRLAVDEARSTSGGITTLSDTAQKIGDIVKLIQDIAGQTNLLALNATIEAARAGESGRGFAVVASEVKSLAVQTAKATEAIAAQIQAVQGSTVSAVESIRRITQRMQEIQACTSAVAASIEQQNAATGDISQNVAGAAAASATVAKVLADVAGAAAQTRASAQTMLDTSQSVEAAADDLRRQVEHFLAGVAV